MPRNTRPKAGLSRWLGLAAVAMLMLSPGARRAEALTLINPVSSAAVKAASVETVAQFRRGGGGHGFRGGGGFGRGAAHVGAFRGGGGARIGAFRGGGVRVGRIGGFRAARVGGFRHGGFRPIYRRHFIHHRFYGGYYVYPRFHRCRVIWTHWGPRRICRWHRWHRHWRHRYW